uniref:COesterase domain-containing protein n=1 Tax=Parastrongyloides trichosuri TaxID=131310 RepID=A0A0N4ZS02_PARTI
MGCTTGKPYCDCNTSTKSERHCDNHSICVNTIYGIVAGFQYTTKEGYNTDVFLGIPFAKPPVGELRFKKPEIPEKWEGILEAFHYKSRSIQKPHIIADFLLKDSISEDCLYLNIVTPSSSVLSNRKYPVMVFIHGGSYYSNCASRYHYSKCASYIVKNDVIFITIQYRLGYLGYFYTGDESCHSNIGLWDQYYALKWINENIEFFNGDPNNITVIGQSAGASSADLLSLSPYSRDLFKKCVLFGGNANALWAVAEKDKIVNICRRKALELGFKRNGKKDNDAWSLDDNTQMISYLRNIPAHMFALSKPFYLDNETIYENCIDFGPVVDGEILPKTPYELRAEIEPKPTLMGICKYEGLLFVAFTKVKDPHVLYNKLIQGQKRRFKKRGIHLEEEDISKILGYDKNEKDKQKCMKKVVKILGFLGLELPILDYLISRQNLNRKLEKEILKQSNKSMLIKESHAQAPIYLFRFDHYNPKNFVGIKRFFPFIGATHCTELNYFIGVNHLVVPYFRNSDDIIVTNFFTRSITNFAKYGDPNEKQTESTETIIWDPVDLYQKNKEEENYEFCFMKIKPKLEMGKNFGNEYFLKLTKFYRYLKEIEIKLEKLDMPQHI